MGRLERSSGCRAMAGGGLLYGLVAVVFYWCRIVSEEGELATDFAGRCLIVLVMRAERARGQWGIINCAAALPVC